MAGIGVFVLGGPRSIFDLFAYSIDLKGSEYYDIYIRDLSTNKLVEKKIKNTSGGISWSLDSKSFFYTPLDKYHRSKKIYKHIKELIHFLILLKLYILKMFLVVITIWEALE